MMEAFLELQKSIYRTHTLLSSGTENLRHLSRYEREQFEFRVKVEKGSSDYKIDLTDIVSKLGNDIVSKMDGTQLVVTVLGLALIVAGTVMFRAYLNQKTEAKKLTVDDDKTQSLLANYQAQLGHDTERFKLLTTTIQQHPVLKQIEQSTNQSRDQILRAVADEDGGSVMGVELSKEVANEISSTIRQQSAEVSISGKYRVAKVDTTIADGFRVTFEDLKTDELINASLLDVLISAKHKETIRNAEWAKLPVQVEMTARRLRGNLVDAKVVNVIELDAKGRVVKS
jgi:serine/threonine protein phosphatase PrpC